MKKFATSVAGGALCLLAGSYFTYAQSADAQHPMSFFVTSVGLPGGANLGGLAGADKHCQDLAMAAGAGNQTWHAYLSDQAQGGQPAVDARDRIGKGPWYNAKGEMIAYNVSALNSTDHLHYENSLTEKGQHIGGGPDKRVEGDRTWAYMEAHPTSVRHEILTGSTFEGRAFTDGRDHTCNNWTSEAKGNSNGRARNNTGPGAQIGKSDDSGSWNSHGISAGCDRESLASSHGAGLFYCFAVN